MAPFVRWSPEHFAALVLTLVVPLVLAAWARRDASGRDRAIAGYFFVVILLGSEIWRPLWLHRIGALPPWQEMMPMHLCDWALIACVVACISRRRLPCELAYFWGLAGTLQGLITPDLSHGFPSPAFFLFFLGHGGIVGTVLFLVASGSFRPRWSSVGRGYAGLLVYGAAASACNVAAQTNYGYVCGKPGVASLLDHLGPWPWYIASLLAVAALNFTLLYVPWAIADRMSGRLRSVDGIKPVSRSR